MSVEQKVVRAEVQVFLNKLRTLDLGPIAYKLMHPEKGRGWTKAKTVRAIARYMAFLGLIYLYPNQQFVPTQEIDAVWHNHILDTTKYHQDCELLFGRYVHHFPYFSLRGEADEQNWQAAFADTQTIFKQHFGIAPSDKLDRSKIWLKAEEKKNKGSRCENLKTSDSKKKGRNRPTVDIKAEVLAVFPKPLS
ncbi:MULTISPECIES: glycine-rich domain-containing protein-like [unclassified Microcoleus]|uniref:glycine-rich domain-containing protein-like n=1 Tax=unclassified Microcoleus TaxID=2642155 RepID=UPI002FD436EB